MTNLRKVPVVYEEGKDYEFSIQCVGLKDSVDYYLKSGELRRRTGIVNYRWIVSEVSNHYIRVEISALFSDDLKSRRFRSAYSQNKTDEMLWNEWQTDVGLILDELDLSGAFTDVDYVLHVCRNPGRPDWGYVRKEKMREYAEDPSFGVVGTENEKWLKDNVRSERALSMDEVSHHYSDKEVVSTHDKEYYEHE